MDYQPVVPINRLQGHLKASHHASERPTSGEEHAESGWLIDVYDRERVDNGNVPDDIVNILKRSPGILFGRVETDRNGTLLLPFLEPSGLVSLTGGNSVALIGSRVIITFKNSDIRGTGQMSLVQEYKKVPLNMVSTTEIWNIGGIFG